MATESQWTIVSDVDDYVDYFRSQYKPPTEVFGNASEIESTLLEQLRMVGATEATDVARTTITGYQNSRPYLYPLRQAGEPFFTFPNMSEMRKFPARLSIRELQVGPLSTGLLATLPDFEQARYGKFGRKRIPLSPVIFTASEFTTSTLSLAIGSLRGTLCHLLFPELDLKHLSDENSWLVSWRISSYRLFSDDSEHQLELHAERVRQSINTAHRLTVASLRKMLPGGIPGQGARH